MNKTLIQQITRMAKKDQIVRKAYLKDVSLVAQTKKIDKLHLLQLKKIVHTYGWPTVSLVGKKAAHLAWLLVQHADTDTNFQKRCLKLMEKAAKTGQVSLGDVAYLTDRVLVIQRQAQIYGTQFYKDPISGWIPRPIIKPQDVNIRRAKMGLNSFEKYAKRMTHV